MSKEFTMSRRSNGSWLAKPLQVVMWAAIGIFGVLLVTGTALALIALALFFCIAAIVCVPLALAGQGIGHVLSWSVTTRARGVLLPIYSVAIFLVGVSILALLAFWGVEICLAVAHTVWQWTGTHGWRP